MGLSKLILIQKTLRPFFKLHCFIDTRATRKPLRRAFTLEEIERLLAVASLVNKAAYLLVIYCGMRRGEVAKLEWADLILSG
ncbi:MAG: hypothetical protein WC071_12370, partial [Victivallaceae bacterium]